MERIWEKNIPHLGCGKDGKQVLFVDGEEFLVLGGEIHNSSSADRAYMQKFVWDRLDRLAMNTLLIPVFWDLVEWDKGTYDFSMQQWIIDKAREHKIRVIFLWFGLWKNGESYYTPAWMKKDTKTYFRAEKKWGVPSATISPLCQEAICEDSKAFAAFMAFLREYDGLAHTVIMVQVENEVGMLGCARDYSPIAQQRYQEEVPNQIRELTGKSGNWVEVYGGEAPEYFMSWYFASALEQIAAAGKQEYPLPMLVNVWLDLFPFRPETYPSGGPIAKAVPVWKKAAPSIDLIAPDIYDPDFYGNCDPYVFDGNGLFIPETGRQPNMASHMIGVFGLYKALGISMFGVDDFLNADIYDEMSDYELDALRIDWHWDRCRNEKSGYIQQAYRLMKDMAPFYLENREMIKGFARRNEHDRGAVISHGAFDIVLSYETPEPCESGSAGIFFPIDETSFLLAGCNAWVRVHPKRGEDYPVEVTGVWEGSFENGRFVEGRKLNGDELFAQCRLTDIPSVLKVEVAVLDGR